MGNKAKNGMDCTKLKFTLLISRDFAVFFLGLNVLVILCSLILWGADRQRERDILFTKYLHWSHPPHLLIDYVCGWLLFLFTVGLISILYFTAWFCGWLCCDPDPPTYDTYNYGFGGYYCYFCWFPTWDVSSHHHHQHLCGHCGAVGSCGDCNCKGNDGTALLVILVVIVILIILLGLIVLIGMTIVLGSRVVKQHAHVLY